MKRIRLTCCTVAVLTAFFCVASPLLAALPSYVFTTEGDGRTYLSKFDGTSTSPTTIGSWSGAGLQANRNSSGSGLSLINESGDILVVNPGTPQGGVADAKFYQVVNNTQWNQEPVGRHGVPASGHPSLAIFRATITGGTAGTPSINSPSAPFVNQSMSSGMVMGNFSSDLFSGAHDEHTYIAAQTNDNYIDLGAFQIGNVVQAANGAIFEALGGVWYVDPLGSMTQLINPNTSSPFTSLDNNLGGKVRNLGYFNSDGEAWFYDSIANTVGSESGAPISAFVRVGNYALAQEQDAVWLFDGTGAASQYLSGDSRFASGLSFGDYALANIDGTTRILRDNGSGIDDASWSGAPEDFTRATGGYLGVVNESIPGDFNNDSKVDAADYVLCESPSANGGDPDGYSTWRARFGNTAPSSGLTSAGGQVPEPTSLLLVIFAIGSAFTSDRAFRRRS